jgi:hypothetical protein
VILKILAFSALRSLKTRIDTFLAGPDPARSHSSQALRRH